MPGYQIHFNLHSNLDQTKLMEKLKSIGEVIQTSNGLCFTCSQSLAEVKNFLNELGFKKLNLTPTEAREHELAPDVQAFLNSQIQ